MKTNTFLRRRIRKELTVAAVITFLFLSVYALKADASGWVLCQKLSDRNVKQAFEGSCPTGWMYVKHL